MTDWLGMTTFELDLLHQMTAATDHAGKRVEYTYDGVGNQTSICSSLASIAVTFLYCFPDLGLRNARL